MKQQFSVRECRLFQLRKEVIRWAQFLPTIHTKEIEAEWLNTGGKGASHCDLTHILFSFNSLIQVEDFIDSGFAMKLSSSRNGEMLFCISIINTTIRFTFVRTQPHGFYELINSKLIVNET